MRPRDERYFDTLETEVEEAIAVANAARERGGDPSRTVEIPVARDMADRVENILGIDGVATRVRELEGEMSREEAALALVSDFVDGDVGDYDTREGTIEGAVRTAVALLTEGVVAAPIEGIDGVEILQNDDGTEFVNVYYAGPIRSAGGTAQALSVLVADYARALLGIDEYKPRSEEVNRYAEEVALYDKDTGLQYTPKEKESEHIAEHMPIMLDGEPTSDDEVSGFRDLDRVDTNAARGGMCLVLAEGIALKAPKIKRYTREIDAVDWPWLDALIEGTLGDGDEDDDTADDSVDAEAADRDETDAGEDASGREDAVEDGGNEPPRPEPSGKYLRDLIAGRPVFAHPSSAGGFRLRYGRARNHGFATAGVHPATMHLVDDFLAAGTQLKTERPGKAAGVVPVDTIEGPTVRLANGDVRRIDDPAEAMELRNGVEAILDLGEYLVNYGEFVENNHDLAPASYTVEWWAEDMAAAGADVQALRDDPHVDLAAPEADAALEWAREDDVPLHPAYTYLWHDVSVAAVDALADAVCDGGVARADGATVAAEAPLELPRTERLRETLEALLVEHSQAEDRLVVDEWVPLVATLGFDPDDPGDFERTWSLADCSERARTYAGGENAIELVDEVAPFSVRERAPTRIGSRMGRPEKSEERELSPAVHTLFPIGAAGGNQRSVTEAAGHAEEMNDRAGRVEVEVANRRCPDCGTDTFRGRCPDCNAVAETVWECPDCGMDVEASDGEPECPRCETRTYRTQYAEIDVDDVLADALDAVGERETAFDVLKGVKGLTSAAKVPEPMEKGVLRAKHDVSAFKDGTVRYDITDLPVTAVRPAELDVTAAQLRELGYEEDVDGEPLAHDDQLVPLMVQDVILSDGAAEHMLRTADFVDELLTEYYGLEPYYELDDRSDLVGELVFGMAPHTSAATVGRVIGFTTASVGYAHPYFHAAKRRNCFHPETKVWYENDDGAVVRDEIEAIVEDRLDDPRSDDFGALVQALDGDLFVPSVTDEGTPTRKPVEAVSKHLSTDHFVQIETDAGHSLTITPDHSMVRWNDGVETVLAHEIEPGDEVLPAPTPPGDAHADPGVAHSDGGVPNTEIVERVQFVESDVECTYSLTVADTHRLVANGIITGQCDGDEDCVMLLMDGLLNFSKTYLPDKRGGSVAEDSHLVANDPEGNVRFLTFGELWEELESPIDVDGKFRKRTCYSEGWQTYVFDERHDASLKPIEKAIRYPAADDEMLLRVQTQFGRTLEITPNHSLFRYNDGIEEAAGEDLSEGDLVLAPRSLDVDDRRTIIDLTEYVEDPYVFIDGTVEDLLRTVWETTERGSDAHADFKCGLEYRLSKGKIPMERLQTVLDHEGFDVPEDAEIGLQGSSSGISRTIDVDEDFAWLVGLFVAEGSTSSVCPTIYNGDERLIETATDIAETTLGHRPERRWSNRAYELRFPAVFRDALYGLGFENRSEYSSSEKVIPQSILHAPKNVAIAFLRGLLAGDGSEPGDDNYTSIQFHTTSEQVKDGVVFLCHRFGLVANVSTRRERDGNRQNLHTVSVSGGSSNNPLRRILDGGDSYFPKSLVVSIPDALMEIRSADIEDVKQLVPKYLKRRDNISLEKLGEIVASLEGRDLPPDVEANLDDLRPLVEGDLSYLRVKSIERVEYDGCLYDLQVGGEPIFLANWLYAHNSMDAPLVMSTRVDPDEIDDEAHNVDAISSYPREFYGATRRQADPAEIREIMALAEDGVGTDREYAPIPHTHDTSTIAGGPDLSAYKTLGSMEAKMDDQLALARKLRAVDETDVAERIIEYHFLPDLIGNLRAFASQETRCLDCSTSYRRMPLTRECRECGGDVHLTVHEGSVTKYLDTATRIAEEFGCREYTKQRLQILDRSIESIFEDDTNKQSGIADFM